MSLSSVKASRGRPKTLNRDHILNVAMQAYWEVGAGDVSINEICRKAKVSKPGLYREFGNEDGLMKEVLLAYQKNMLTPILHILNADTTFRETLDELVLFVTADNDDQEMPRGCLVVQMRESRTRMGEATREQIDLTEKQVLTMYEEWVERSKAKGEFSADMTSQFAATYIDAQLSHALSQIARGESKNNVKNILKVALSML